LSLIFVRGLGRAENAENKVKGCNLLGVCYKKLETQRKIGTRRLSELSLPKTCTKLTGESEINILS